MSDRDESYLFPPVYKSAMRQAKNERSNCDGHCPCICHDGFGGAHPSTRCKNRDVREDR